MLIDISNVLTDKVLAESSIWTSGGGMMTGPIAADILLFENGGAIEGKGVDLLRFYFDFMDTLVQATLRNLVSHVRIEFEIECSFLPFNDGESVIEVIFPDSFSRKPMQSLHLSIRDVREMVQLLEVCIRSQLGPFRQKLFSAFEQSQSGWLFDIIRIIDQDIELSSETAT